MKIARHILLYLILTERCNYHCSFCIRNNIGHKAKEFEYDSVMFAIEKLSELFPSSILLLTGGEPTLHPHFREIVEHSLEKFFAVQVTSNGSFGGELRNYLSPLLKQNLYLQMSLDGTSFLHNKIRGMNAFESVIDNLINLNDVSSHVSLSSTVIGEDFEDVKELAKLLNSYSFSHLKVSSAIDSNVSNTHYNTARNWNKFVDEILPLCNYPVDIKKIYDFDLMRAFATSSVKDNVVTNCGIGYSKLYIRPNFDILTCSCTNNVIGNLKDCDLTNLKDNLAKLQHRPIDESSICSSCEFKEICNGGCPGYSLKVFGKPNFGDIRCPKVYEFAKKLGKI